MSCSLGIQTVMFGKKDGLNYNIRGISVERGITEAEYPECVPHILNATSDYPQIKRWLGPRPDKGQLADRSLFRKIPNFGNIERGPSGDIVELLEGEGYLLSFADCMMGGVTLPDGRNYAFHTGWAQLLDVIEFFGREIKNLPKRYGDLPTVKASYGFCRRPEDMTLEIRDDTPPDLKLKIEALIVQAKVYDSWEKVSGKDTIDMMTLFRKKMSSSCSITSNTCRHLNEETDYSHRGNPGGQFRNLGAVYFN